jgi:hypothetical protein
LWKKKHAGSDNSFCTGEGKEATLVLGTVMFLNDTASKVEGKNSGDQDVAGLACTVDEDPAPAESR